MSLNSFVTPGGAEIGRAQAMQADGGGHGAGRADEPGTAEAGQRHAPRHRARPASRRGQRRAEYRTHSGDLLKTALDSLEDLRAEYDVVICEGAGSPAEINLRDTDIANMGLARAAGLPVIVVGDIDRGGVFAALYGTLALLHPGGPGPDQRVRGQQVPRRRRAARSRAWAC